MLTPRFYKQNQLLYKSKCHHSASIIWYLALKLFLNIQNYTFIIKKQRAAKKHPHPTDSWLWGTQLQKVKMHYCHLHKSFLFKALFLLSAKSIKSLCHTYWLLPCSCFQVLTLNVSINLPFPPHTSSPWLYTFHFTQSGEILSFFHRLQPSPSEKKNKIKIE